MNLINEIDENKDGVYEFETSSNSKYIIIIDGQDKNMMRVPDKDGVSLRKDSKKIKIAGDIFVKIGHGAMIVLEGLGEPPHTIRQTTEVIKITQLN